MHYATSWHATQIQGLLVEVAGHRLTLTERNDEDPRKVVVHKDVAMHRIDGPLPGL